MRRILQKNSKKAKIIFKEEVKLKKLEWLLESITKPSNSGMRTSVNLLELNLSTYPLFQSQST